MKTNQPSWHCITNHGDVDPLNHGGEFILIDRRGIYTPELWIYTPNETEGKRGTWCKVQLELCTRIKDGAEGIVSDSRFHPDDETWWDLPAIASFIGESVYHVADQITSSDPCERAVIYSALVNYYGAENFGGTEKLDTWKADRVQINRLLRQIAAAQNWKDGLA